MVKKDKPKSAIVATVFPALGNVNKSPTTYAIPVTSILMSRISPKEAPLKIPKRDKSTIDITINLIPKALKCLMFLHHP